MKKLFDSFCAWPPDSFRKGDGVVVAADLSQEWLLPWWWEHYRKQNTHPVAFIDLGMSEEMKAWCRERGIYMRLAVPDIFVALREEIASELVEQMEKNFGKEFWPSRDAWFKKPLACLMTPFERSVWIDLDCKVLGSIEALFAYAGKRLGIAKEQAGPVSCKVNYNSGVFAFRGGLNLIAEWARACLDASQLFRGDQDVLSYLIERDKVPVGEIPPVYNWSRTRERTSDAVIVHFHGPQGKAEISHEIIRAELQAFFP